MEQPRRRTPPPRLLTSHGPGAVAPAAPQGRDLAGSRGATRDAGTAEAGGVPGLRGASAVGRGERRWWHSDARRADVATVLALGGASAFLLLADADGGAPAGLGDIGSGADLRDWVQATAGTTWVPFLLVFSALFGAVYVGFTALAFGRLDHAELLRVAELSAPRSRMVRWFGYGGASSWTISGAVFAAVLSVTIAQNPTFHGSMFYVLLGLAAVATSWAVMVCSYALSVLVSAMAAMSGMAVRGRRGLRVVREHVVLAFAFNAVIVAMTVSVLFGGLAG
ncbi:hypothetical protein [Brevibacterium samyangense]|uniref:Uncharacterized protein n=1 Tax=Brevibacterium samyangense TaxID=366888 RepID=A0ABN2TG56_9MICO